MEGEIFSSLVSSGPLGLVIAYLMYREKVERDLRTVERARRDKLDEDRLTTDKAMVGAMTTLAVKLDELAK